MARLQAGAGALRLSTPDDSHGEASLQSLALDRSTLAARAHDAIRAAIVDGRLAAGERYSVARLAERFGVSRTPVREALLLLEREGVVRFERNRGVRVLETSAHDLEEVFTLRLLLEVPATYRACRLLGDDDLEALQHELDAMEALAHSADEGAFMAHDTRFHELILLAAGNRRLAKIIGGLRDLVRFRGASTVGRSRGMRAIHAEHAAVLAALRGRDPAAAAERMRDHLLNTARLLIAQEGESDHALAWAPLVHVGDERP
ncbi:MAG TPA: GntR family transcriptional regulator [Solirubrobacteraceae bacterium]